MKAKKSIDRLLRDSLQQPQPLPPVDDFWKDMEARLDTLGGNIAPPPPAGPPPAPASPLPALPLRPLALVGLLTLAAVTWWLLQAGAAATPAATSSVFAEKSGSANGSTAFMPSGNTPFTAMQPAPTFSEKSGAATVPQSSSAAEMPTATSSVFAEKSGAASAKAFSSRVNQRPQAEESEGVARSSGLKLRPSASDSSAMLLNDTARSGFQKKSKVPQPSGAAEMLATTSSVFAEQSGTATVPQPSGAAEMPSATLPVFAEKSGAAETPATALTATAAAALLSPLGWKSLKTSPVPPNFEKIRCAEFRSKNRPVWFAYLGAEPSQLPIIQIEDPRWLSAGLGAEWAMRRHPGWGLRGEAWFHQFEALPFTITSVQHFGPEKERVTRYDSLIVHRTTRVALNAQVTRRFGHLVLLGGLSGGWTLSALTEAHDWSKDISGQVFSSGYGYGSDAVPPEMRRFYLGLKVGAEYHPLPRWVLGATMYQGLNDVVRSPRYNVANDVLVYLGYKF